MNASARLIEMDDLSGCPFPFFDDTPKDDGTPKTYKIYNDGHHLIATHCWRADGYAPQPVSARKKKADDLTDMQKNIVFNRIMRDIRKENARRKRPTVAQRIDISSNTGKRGERSAFDILFDDLFMQAYNKGLRDRKIYKPMSEYIYSGLLSLFSESEIAEVDIAERVKRKLNNLLHRKKRFRRKAYLNKWNFFVTFTYNDAVTVGSSFESGLEQKANCRAVGRMPCNGLQRIKARRIHLQAIQLYRLVGRKSLQACNGLQSKHCGR